MLIIQFSLIVFFFDDIAFDLRCNMFKFRFNYANVLIDVLNFFDFLKLFFREIFINVFFSRTFFFAFFLRNNYLKNWIFVSFDIKMTSLSFFFSSIISFTLMLIICITTIATFCNLFCNMNKQISFNVTFS